MNMHICSLIFLFLAADQIGAQEKQQQVPMTARSVLGPQGIVVPKRSSFIFGLNEQFKPKQTGDNKNVSSTSSTQASVSSDTSTSSFLANRLPTFLLGARGFQFKKQQQQQQQILEQQALVNLQDKQTLYLDRYQQEMLAANPNLTIVNSGQFNSQIRAQGIRSPIVTATTANGLLPPANLAPGTIQNTLLVPDIDNSQIQKSLIQTIPLGEPFKQQYHNTQPTLVNASTSFQNQLQSVNQKSVIQQANEQQPATTNQPQSHLYRGFSLFELDIKSESERRYMKDLYANLSSVINEQASNPNTSPQVSPYVDVDFWSFGRASPNNDQIDVMVSPRSKPFLMAQLAKARIRYRVKIDDIQARIDRDQANQAQQQQNDLPMSSDLGLFSSLPLMNPFSYSNTNSLSLSNDKVVNRQHHESSLHGRQSNDNPQLTNSGSSTGSGTTTATVGPRLVNESAFFENYQRLQLINQYLEYIVQRDSDVAQVKVIGRSSQGRHLRVLKLGYERMDGAEWDNRLNSPLDGPLASADGAGVAAGARAATMQHINATHIMHQFFARQQSTEKLGSIWLDGGTHAREWISVSTVLYLAFRLSDNHNRCGKFFNSLKTMVNDYEQSIASGSQQLYQQQQQQQQQHHHQQAANAASMSQLESNLFNGLNELDAQLLLAQKFTSNGGGLTGKQAGSPSNMRPRSEMEQMLELISKNPQIVASEYGCDLEVDQLLRRYTFFIMPVLNPDGYEYSHTHNRLWRKTRSTSNHPIYRHFCLGADPNRNYDAHHGSTGSSSHPCSQTFAGATPFTEPETRHQSNFVYANRFGMKMYISFHSYSQMILLPLSHSKGTIPDLKDLESVANAASKAIEGTHGTQYRVGQSAAILYTAAGTASDWAYEKANVKYSYTIELRDTGSYGFLLPRQQIIPTGEETFNGLLAMISQMEKNDNLLTSKSTPLTGNVGDRGSSNQAKPALIDYNRASQSDLDRLNNFMSTRRRAQLESVNSNVVPSNGNDHHTSGDIVNSIESGVSDPSASGGAQATAGSNLIGVRDRRPNGPAPGEQPISSNDISASSPNDDQDSYDNSSENMGPALIAMSPMDPLGQPIVEQPHDHDGESGYAFEGEGELMEPATSLRQEQYLSDISGARAHVSESKLTSRRLDTVKRIGQMTRLGGNGRNSINIPGPFNGDVVQVSRRESSGNLLLSQQTIKKKKMIS